MLILGFPTAINSDNMEIYGILGAHITDKKSNVNGLKMLEYCNKEEFFVANSFFKSTRSTGSNTCGAPIKGRTDDDIDRFRYTSTIDYILIATLNSWNYPILTTPLNGAAWYAKYSGCLTRIEH